MDLKNLNQFSKKDFKKFFGIYAREQRQLLRYSHEELASRMGLDPKVIKAVEAGQKRISQEDFDLFFYHLQMDPRELLNIGKITQVQYILNVYKEADELYPK